MLDFAQCERLVSTARDKRSKPVDNNTRVERRDEDTYALRLHATDIATFHRDGRITLNSGGWRTNTTRDRLRAVTSHLSSERGIWYIDAEPDPQDPKPEYGRRSVPKPFHALDPGPEPVDTGEGCIAGTEQWREWDEEKLVSQREIDGGVYSEADIVRPYEPASDYFAGYVMAHRRELTVYGEPAYSYGVDLPTVGINESVKYEQCPHCKLFAAQHRAWSEAMNGGGWGRNRTLGYAEMTKRLEMHGGPRFYPREQWEKQAREAWQDAYLADFRATREQRKLYKDWLERNRVLFEDGMEITAEGYAKRPNLKEIAKAQRREKAIERKKARVNKFVADAVNELATNGLPLPGNGDCWGCLMHTADDPTSEPFGTDHLEEHIRERYYVPSMFVNALREAGYRDAGIAIFLGMDFESGTMKAEQPSGRYQDNVTRALRRYLYRRLIPETYGAGMPGAEVTA